MTQQFQNMAGLSRGNLIIFRHLMKNTDFCHNFSGLVCQTLADQETGKDYFLIKAEEELEVHFKGERMLSFCFNFYLNY